MLLEWIRIIKLILPLIVSVQSRVPALLISLINKLAQSCRSHARLRRHLGEPILIILGWPIHSAVLAT